MGEGGYRTRIAPTVSGLLHVGHARTFLAACARAREAGGKVVLRIDDIDFERCSKEYEDAAVADMKGAGIFWDEGPDVGGAFGPYRQSERIPSYEAAMRELAARGFLTVAFDPSYTGESGGTPRYVASPDINTEDFSAAVDFLSVRDDVDPERIGILGICGWGGMALNAAAIDTRIKATVTSTMYDMTRVTANGYFDTDDNPDARYALRQALNAQRTADYKAGTYQRAGGVVDPVPDDAPFFVKDYHDYYKTPRGYHPRSLNSNDGWNVTSPLSLLNAKLLAYANEIRSAVLVIHGDKAHSCYFSRDAFAKLQGDNKELLLIPGAVHTDLYDRMDIIPFDRIEAFYRQYLK